MSEQVEAKKPHPFSKAARDEKAKAEKEIQVEERELTFEELYNIPSVDIDKQYQFEFLDVKQNANLGIPNHCEIFDPIEKRIRVIRYAPHEVSVFEDEQKELPQGGYYNDTIQFPYSECRIDGKKKTLVQFMFLHNANITNSNPLPSRHPKFKLVDKEADAAKMLAENAVRTKAAIMATECDDSEMLPYAKVLGININRSMAEVRQEFVVASTKKPIEFIKGINDPKNKRLYVVLLAFEQNIITDTHIKNEIHFLGSKVKITDIPAGKISSDYLCDWSFSSKEAEETFKQIQKLVIV